jgi:hypothetical protein
MAATSTNKQPLLVDRVLHYVVNLDTAINSTIDIVGTNTAVPIINAVSSDGAIVEDIYSFSRGSASETINLYLSDASDYLRPNEGILVGQFTSSDIAGTVTRWSDMPFTLTPVPHVGTEARNRALYIPKGKALWAARESTAVLTNGPLLGCQGGWF